MRRSTYTPQVNSEEPTPFMSLCEGLAFGAYFLWQLVLAAGPREAGEQPASPGSSTTGRRRRWNGSTLILAFVTAG
jgi:hypothetical protein